MILHEEAEDGNAMPDLARPVQAVKLAVDNLIKVILDTIVEPPANEVWGKVMFLHMSIILSTRSGVYMMSLLIWLPGPMFLLVGGGGVSGPIFLPGGQEGLCPEGSP